MKSASPQGRHGKSKNFLLLPHQLIVQLKIVLSDDSSDSFEDFRLIMGGVEGFFHV